MKVPFLGNTDRAKLIDEYIDAKFATVEDYSRRDEFNDRDELRKLANLPFVMEINRIIPDRINVC